jgi:hypothetical protein
VQELATSFLAFLLQGCSRPSNASTLILGMLGLCDRLDWVKMQDPEVGEVAELLAARLVEAADAGHLSELEPRSSLIAGGVAFAILSASGELNGAVTGAALPPSARVLVRDRSRSYARGPHAGDALCS